MAVALKVDIVDGARGRISGSGWEFTRMAKLTGYTDVTDPAMKLILATKAVGVPQIGDKYPGVNDLRLEEYSINADSPSVFAINLIYRGGPQLGLIETGASVSEESTNLDYQGNLIKLTYGGKEQSGTVRRLVPSRYWKTKRTINYDPKYEIKTYPGKVNAAGWSIDPSAAARQWFCMNIASNSVDGGKTYDVTYEFLFKDPNWDETTIYTDPDTGRPPVDAVPVVKQIYKEIDFDGLNL